MNLMGMMMRRRVTGKLYQDGHAGNDDAGRGLPEKGSMMQMIG
jgi:hypothetical protein